MIFSQKLKTSINQKVKNKKKTFAIEGMANVLQAFEQISMTPSKITCEPHHQQNAPAKSLGHFCTTLLELCRGISADRQRISTELRYLHLSFSSRCHASWHSYRCHGYHHGIFLTEL